MPPNRLPARFVKWKFPLKCPIVARVIDSRSEGVERDASNTSRRLGNEGRTVSPTVKIGAHSATMIPQEPILSEMLRTTLKRIARS